MSDEVRIPVDLDTRGASSKLRGLESKKARANTRARSQIWGKMRARAAKSIGTVSGYASIGAITRLHTGQANPWAEAMKPVEAAVQQFVDEQAGSSVIARRRARETTVTKLGRNVGLSPGVMPAAKEFFQTELKVTTPVVVSRIQPVGCSTPSSAIRKLPATGLVIVRVQDCAPEG